MDDASFGDALAFPGLTTDAFLQATLTLSGTASGDLSDSSAAASVALTNSAGVSVQCAVTNGSPIAPSFKSSCTASLAVTPSDGATGVRLSGLLGMTANAVASTVGVTDNVTLQYNKSNQGANIALAILDASGKPINGVKITATSGTKYPAH